LLKANNPSVHLKKEKQKAVLMTLIEEARELSVALYTYEVSSPRMKRQLDREIPGLISRLHEHLEHIASIEASK